MDTHSQAPADTWEALRGRATITVEEVAVLLGVGRSAAYDAARRGDLPALRVGRRLLIPVPRLLQMLGGLPSAEPGAQPSAGEEAR